MTNLRRILALVLVMAMTFTMLPVLAAAEDVAVETVAPVAEAPAVEDVAAIPETAPAEAPAAAAIETAPAETVAPAAELQATVEPDDPSCVAKIVAYDIDGSVITEEGHTSLREAYETAGSMPYLCEVILMQDVAYVATSSTFGGAMNKGFITGAASSRANYLTWGADNETDPEATVKGFWLNLNGHTVTVRCMSSSDNNHGYYSHAMYTNGSVPINVKNGTIIYKYSRTTQSGGFALIACGYHTSTSNQSAIGTAEELYNPAITLKDVNLYRVHNTGDLEGKEYSNAGPVIAVTTLESNIKAIRSRIITTGGSAGAIYYNRNPYSTTAPEGIGSVTHNLELTDCIVGHAAGGAVIRTSSVRPANGLLVDENNLNITLDGTTKFLCGETLINSVEEENGLTINFPAAENLIDSAETLEIPDVNSLLAIPATTVGVAPEYLPGEAYAVKVYDPGHVHTLQHVDAVAPTYETAGVAEHYICTACGAYIAADGVTETTLEALTIPSLVCAHENIAYQEEVPATFTETGVKAHYACTLCGNKFQDQAGTIPADEDWLTIPKRGVAQVVCGNDVTEYATLKEAYQAAGAMQELCEVVLQTDVTYVVSSGTAWNNGVINGTARDKAGYLTWDLENTSDPEVTVNGFWLNLNGHTVTVRCMNGSTNNDGTYNHAIYVNGSIPVNIKNGTIIYKYSRTTQNHGFALMALGYAASASNSSAIGTAEDLYTPTVTLKDVNLFRVHNGGDLDGKAYSNAGPVISVATLASNINIIRSTVFSTDSYAVYYNKNEYKTTAPEGLNTVEHNLTIRDSVVGSGSEVKGAIYSKSVAVGLAVENTNLNVGIEGATKLVGPAAVTVAEGGPALNFPAATGLVGATAEISIPDVDSMLTVSETTVGAAPEYLPAAAFAARVYDPNHVHTPEPVAEVPATYTETGVAAHCVCSVCGAILTADGATETTLDALTIPVLTCPHENKEYHAAEPATYTATGVIEYWHCTDCGKYFTDEACQTEVTEAELVEPIRICKHPDIQHHDPVPATFAEAGMTAYWFCAECGKYFTDETGETETTAAALSTTKRAADDTEGLSDADMVALGAIFKTVSPEGAVKAYTSANAAYKEGAAWTAAGGTVTMLCDYTYVDAYEAYTGLFDNGVNSKATNHAWEYQNADNPALKGFWVDLGGHTLVARTGRALFGPLYSLPVNLRNGRIIYQNTAAHTSNYGVFKNGATSQRLNNAEEIFRPVYTLVGVTLIRIPHAAKEDFGAASNPISAPIFHVGALQSEINLIDSTVINADGATAVRYVKTSPSANEAYDALASSKGYQHTVNVSGTSVLGSTTSMAVLCTNAGNGNTGDEADYIRVNAEGGNVTFLGSSILTLSNEELNAVSTAPEGYYSPVADFAFTMPDVTTLGVETAQGADFSDEAEATECKQWIKAVDGSAATFTPEEGTESAQMTLSEAFGAWAAAGYKGTIKLLGNLTPDDANSVKAEIGGTGTSYSTDTEALPFEALYQIPAAASNGNLTLDFNNCTAELASGLIGMEDGLARFHLSIKNASITSSASRPIVVLKGLGGSFKLDNSYLANTAETAYTNTIMDARYGSAYAILTNSTVSSAYRAPIALYTTSETGTDSTLLYYIKGCALETLGGEKQATICSLSSIGETYRPYTVIIDEGTYITNDVDGNFINLRDSDAQFLAAATAGAGESLYMLTVEGESKLNEKDPAATLTFGTELTLPFGTLSDAVEFAEAFGRNVGEYVYLVLEKDAAVTESKAIGRAGCNSVFAMQLNGKTISGEGLIEADGGAGTRIEVTVLGDGPSELKLFAHAPALAYVSGRQFIVEKGRFFTNYSLNLEDSVSINLYTDGTNGDPDSMTYVQDGADYTIAAPGEEHDWIVNTLAAKQMSEEIDAYAVKTDGGRIYLDFVKGVSVKGYAAADPASAAGDADVAEKLNATLKTMLIYGKFAEKYFAGDYSDLTEDELTSINVDFIPQTDTTNLVHADRTVTGMADLTTDKTATSGFYGTSAVLEDSISLKFYFYGAEFEGATAKIGDADAAVEKQDDYYVVKAKVSAKNFDDAITVALTASDGTTALGSVTDSVEAYTARVIKGEDAYMLVQALRAYGADAKRFAEAKAGA